MQVRRGNECMDACTLRRLHRLGDTLYIRTIATSESGDHRTFDLRRDQPHCFGIVTRGDGEPGLEHIHPQGLELPRKLQLFRGVHGKAWGLLTVPQGGIEDNQLVVRHGVSPCRPRTTHCAPSTSKGRIYNVKIIMFTTS